MKYGVKEKRTKWIDVVRKWEKSGREGGVPPGVRIGPKMKSRASRDYYWSNNGYLLRPEVSSCLVVI